MEITQSFFPKLVHQLWELVWVLGVTEGMVSGDGEARVTLDKVRCPGNLPLQSSPNPLLFIIRLIRTRTAMRMSREAAPGRRGKNQTEIKFLLKHL